jgi:hypothetical protein
MTLAWMLGTGEALLPVRTTLILWTFTWPAAIAIAMVAGSTRATKSIIVGTYAAVYAALTVIGVIVSPTTTARDLVVFWALNNLPGSALLLLALSRRIRAVGPMVLVFLILGFIGADLLVTVVGTRDSFMRTAARAGVSTGIGGSGAFYAMLVFGFLIFAGIGWLALVWIRRLYRAKRISDESIALDAMFALFTFSHAMTLAFESPSALLGGAVSFVVYKIVSRIGLAWIGRPAEPHPRLLLLRAFSIGPAAERLFDAIGKHWRRLGSIELIAGTDLVSRTVEPHEFLDFLSGKLGRLFIDSPEAFNGRLRERDVLPDRDGRFRSNDFFCYDNTWRFVFGRLACDCDVVLMDLRGFSPANSGCVFEIHQLVRTVPLEHVVFLVDGHTDDALLRATFRDGAAGAAVATSPHVRRFDRLDTVNLRDLLGDLAAAVAAH